MQAGMSKKVKLICDFKKLLTLSCRCHKSYIDQLLVDHRVYAIQFENTLFDQSVLLDVTGLLFFVFYWFCWWGCIWRWPFGRPRIRKKTSVWSGCPIWLLGYVFQWSKKYCYKFVFFHSCTNICLAFFTYSFAKKISISFFFKGKLLFNDFYSEKSSNIAT